MFHSSTTQAACSDCVVVSTGTGSVQGVRRTVFSFLRVQSFRGIPYAKAPVGELRFQKPVPVEPWEGVLDATQTPPTCMQTTTVDAENLIGFPYDIQVTSGTSSGQTFKRTKARLSTSSTATRPR
ncbi:putative acetylcholinesterase [Ixodes scapularis]